MKLLINGAGGRLGRAITALLAAEGRSPAGLVDPGSAGMLPSLSAFTGEADCVIDASVHTAAPVLAQWAADRGIPAVICTTGHTEEELAAIRAASVRVPILQSENLSRGSALLTELARQAALCFPRADVEITELHHRGKTDRPSGTALMLARVLEAARAAPGPIGIHSLRAGRGAGVHTVLLDDGDQLLTLTHEARDLTPYARGALAAAAFLAGKAAGLYTADGLLGEREVL